MKNAFVALALSAFAASAMAAPAHSDKAPVVEVYTQSQKLDVAQVISTKDVSDAYGFVREQMTYLDSKGQTHVLNYVNLPVEDNG